MKSRLLLFAALLLPLSLAAQEADPVSSVLRELEAGAADAGVLEKAVPLLADPEWRNRIRTEILTLDPFPAEGMVSLLSDPGLAVRLGSLELLEEKAGGDFSFNPWLPPGDPANEGPLARWKKWAGNPAEAGEKKDLLGEEQRRGYLRDLLGGDADKASRARRMLEADGLGAVGFLETFLAESPALPAGSRAKVREAQYQIVLSRPLGPQAAATARQLAFGSRDQTLAALGVLRGTGLMALPVLRDFLNHPDPLVRETSIDAMLAAGGARALAVTGPVLAAETDVNVIHGALRRLKEIPGDESLKIAVSFLNREDEDLLVSAIQACRTLAGGDNDSFSPPGMSRSGDVSSPETKKAVETEILRILGDPRWRVRTAALEYVAGTKMSAAKERCVEMLSDPDEFVRFSAIKAAAVLRADGAAPKLKQMMMDDPGMTGPVFEGYAALGQSPDDEMLAKLDASPPDARLAAVRAAETGATLLPVVLRLAADKDTDVSCAAIRYLSASEDRVKTASVATVLLEALRSGMPEKRAAVVDRLSLPVARGGAAIDPELMAAVSRYTNMPGEKTVLDPMYDAFLTAAGKQAAKPAAVERKVIPGAQGELLKALAEVAAGDTPEAFRAALCLGKAGDPEGLKALISRLPGMSTAQRAAIAEQLYNPTRKEALELLRLLLRDPVEEIRTAAARSALSNDDAPAFLTMVLDELAAPGAELQPHEIYSYSFESQARQSKTAKYLRSWALEVIGREDAPAPARVLALVALRHAFPASAAEPVLRLAQGSPDRWVRRAAWFALGNSKSSAFRDNLATLVEDPAPQVRAILPEVASRADSVWQHRFDDVRGMRDNAWDSDRGKRPLPAVVRESLVKLAADDPAPEVRFEAMLALVSQGQPVDAEAFAALIPRQPEESDASARVGSWMAANARKLGPGLAPVAAALDVSKLRSGQMEAILSAVAPAAKGEAGFASFAALASSAETGGEATQQAAPEENGEDAAEARTTLKVVYFFKPGCAECEKAEQLLETLSKDFPLLEVEEHNITESRGTVLNQALCSRFRVPTLKHTVSPAIFTQGGYLVKEDIAPQALGKLLAATAEMPQDDSWSVVAEPEIAAAAQVVEKRIDTMTLPLVLGAGLIDGLNPCAFATIIFFLSYLQVARRTPREMLMVGAAFILAVFLAYFMAGLVLHTVLEKITAQVAGIRRYLDWAFGGLALLAALLSFRDAIKAKAGKLDEMTLQLPGFLKDRIRGVIRTGAKARRFVIAAFAAGFVISFLELACTGQVYAPIIYGIQQGRGDAVAWLLAYNLAFITPLVVIFLLAFTGMSNKRLIEFQTRHTFAVKIALGLIFTALAGFILFGGRLLHTA